jgi:hypothetical protein
MSVKIPEQNLQYLRNMEIHILIALTTGAMLHKSGTTALDLDTASGLLLDVLHISATMTNNLSTKVEAREWFEIDWNLLFGPFTLIKLVMKASQS